MGCMTSYPVPHTAAGAQFSGSHVLIASSSNLMRQRVLESLNTPVQICEQASGGAEALLRLESGSWQILFLDRHLPDLDAIELSQTVRSRYPQVEVVLLEAEQDAGRGEAEMSLLSDGSIPNGPSATFEQKSVEVFSRLDQPNLTASTSFNLPTEALEFFAAADEKGVGATQHLLPEPIVTADPLPGMVGNSAAMSSRSQRGFAVVNCAAIPETLLEAELFGYARGAFTGAMQAYAGRIQAAHGGTLFLDEIGEMPLSLQPKLLRFLEQKEVQRLGSSEVIRVDARIVSATNAHLLSLVREGKFREDLYYRLCGFPVEIPALRDRGEDVSLLAAYFLEKFSQSAVPRLNPPQLSIAARQLLEAQTWPGNIRELQNVMERALILAENRSVIRPEHLMLNSTHRRNFN